ncbi:MAG: RNA recognition motif domain-containing protein [Candidatus Binatia bacterium]
MTIMLIFVANINYHAEDSELCALFETYGAVETFRIRRNEKGQSQGYGWVTMEDAAAARAIHELNGINFNGRPLVVQKSENHNTKRKEYISK